MSLFDLSKDVQNVICYGINLEERKDKRKKIKKLCEKKIFH